MTLIDQTAVSLDIERHFAAPPERVFDAWLGPEFGDWLPPSQASGAVVSCNPVVGGTYHVRMTMAHGRAVEVRGRYIEISPPHRLVFTWKPNYGVDQEMIVTVSLREDRGGTLMTFRVDGIPGADMRDRYKEGWAGRGGSFDKLAERLARA